MDKFCLKWNNFDTNVKEYFRKLRGDQALHDVTLVTEDGKHIKAHKIILSAASNFFREIFEKSHHTNLLIYLKGINSSQLDDVIDFMYNGEALVAQEEIKMFLETGIDLQVKGLHGELSGIKENFHEEEKIFKCNEPNDKDIFNKDKSDQMEAFCPVEPTQEYSTSMNVRESDELDVEIEDKIEKHGSIWKCKTCGRTATQKTAMRKHAETHIEGMSHACHICSKTFPNRPCLQMHISGIHSQLFSCDLCGKSEMNRGAYNKHKQRNHKL